MFELNDPVYIDTNIWIYAITSNPTYEQSCRVIMREINNRKIDATISTHVLIEVSGVLFQQYKIKDTTKYIDSIISLPIHIIEITPEIVRITVEYSAKYNITPYDAIHVAACTSESIFNIISADKDFDKIDLIKRIDPKELA